MESLDTAFKSLVRALGDSQRLNPASHKPVYYFVFPPEDLLLVRSRLLQWVELLKASGHPATPISFGRMIWTTIAESGRWELWRASEGRYDKSTFNQSVSNLLTAKLPQLLEAELNTLGTGHTAVLYGAELLHPWLRTRALEHNVASAAPGPVIILYPGRRSGQYGLEFLGFYEVDGNYRSSMYGSEA